MQEKYLAYERGNIAAEYCPRRRTKPEPKSASIPEQYLAYERGRMSPEKPKMLIAAEDFRPYLSGNQRRNAERV